MSEALKLRAEDPEDFTFVSACLQDALVPLSDMRFLADERTFVLVANRFRWENCEETAEQPFARDVGQPEPEVEDAMFKPCRSYERVNCGVRFDGVRQVRCKGFDQRERGRIMELLTCQREPGAVTLLFSGGGALRLEGDSIRCRIEDIGEPWPTTWRPHHTISDNT